MLVQIVSHLRTSGWRPGHRWPSRRLPPDLVKRLGHEGAALDLHLLVGAGDLAHLGELDAGCSLVVDLAAVGESLQPLGQLAHQTSLAQAQVSRMEAGLAVPKLRSW